PVTHQLINVTDPSGVVQTYSYGTGAEAGLLKTIQVPGGQLVTFVYAASTGVSLLNSVQDWNGRIWTFQYDTNRNLTTLITPIGCTTVYGYTAIGTGTATLTTSPQDPLRFVPTFAYDSSSRLISLTAGTGVWRWAYSAGGPGIPPSRILTSPSGALTTFILDSGTGLVTSIQRPEGYTTT